MYPPFHFFGSKFFYLNPHKWHPLIAGSPPVQKFFDLSPPRPSYRPPKIFKKKFFFAKNMFLGVFGVADHESAIIFEKFSALGA